MKPETRRCLTLTLAIFLTVLCSCTANVGIEPVLLSRIQATNDTSKTYVYECTDGMSFPVNIKKEHAWVFLPKETLNLPLVPSASGAKYSDGKTIFWSKGQEAYLNIGTGAQITCTNNPQRAVWEHAKLSGVDFRAVGNEPGWYLEIRHESIRYVGDYGSTSHIFPKPQQTVATSSNQTTYLTRDAENELNVQIEGKQCHDTMSGEEFESTVTIRLNGTIYLGCGRALH